MVMRGCKILICLLLIVSVATILISPNQNDDVPGVLHHVLKIQKLLAVWASLNGVIAVVVSRPYTPFTATVEPDPPQLLPLLCVRIC